MTADPSVRVWAQIGEHARGAPLTIAHVCAAAVAGLGVDGAGVTTMVSATVRDTVHATDRTARELEEWQLALGQGPCVDAFVAGGPVLVTDLGTPEQLTRWPAFAPAGVQSGARAVFALPLQIGVVRLGVLCLYRAEPGRLSPAVLADALAFADTVGSLLVDEVAATQPDTTDLGWQRDDPTAHDAQVHQATGMVLVQLGISAEGAFARLRAYAYARDLKLGDVARDVVARRLRFTSE